MVENYGDTFTKLRMDDIMVKWSDDSSKPQRGDNIFLQIDKFSNSLAHHANNHFNFQG